MEIEGLVVADELYRFITEEALPGSGVDAGAFWKGFSDLIHDFGPRNRGLLERRAELQAAIDDWHRANRGRALNGVAYRAFLEGIGYIEPSGAEFSITTSNVDPEMAEVAGPQLVVPIMNARFALNALNARWGSLYDALYGTDALGDPPPAGPYDPARGRRVAAWCRGLLDDVVPLSDGSHADATRYSVADGGVRVRLSSGMTTGLARPDQLAGYQGTPDSPGAVLLRNNGLHIAIEIDTEHPVGADDPAGMSDIVMEAAVTTILDLEDSVAAVDAEDKALAYRNLLGLTRGDLTAEVTKNGRTFTRRLAQDRTYTAPDGSGFTLPGLSLFLARNVGHLMTTPAVLDRDGKQAHEGLVDAMVTTLVACHDLRGPAAGRNSRTGSFYVVKPKMHGSDEAAFTSDVFDHVEDVLGLPRDTVKIGLMDEERRTTLNLAECIRAARSRIVFINTGFLDRTGDEIHTSMEAGPMVPKTLMKAQGWIQAYEDWNVDVGIACGLQGRAQIGKGMWAAPDLMAAMLEEKVGHPMAGADCAWVPSPAAATLHATHYHRVDVTARQDEISRPVTPRPGGAARDPAGPEDRLDTRGDRRRAPQQRTGDPGLRGAVGRSGDRLLQGSRHQRHRSHGGPGHLPHLVPAHRQLAPPRGGGPRSGHGDDEEDGGGGRSPERRRSRLPAHGAGLRRPGLQSRLQPGVPRDATALRLYGTHPAREACGIEAPVGRWLIGPRGRPFASRPTAERSGRADGHHILRHPESNKRSDVCLQIPY